MLIATPAVVVTDVVESTSLMQNIGADRWREVYSAHLTRERELVRKFGGREVKTLGDGMMVTFPSAVQAIDFVVSLYADPGHEQVQIRAGVNLGPVMILEEEDNDLVGI